MSLHFCPITVLIKEKYSYQERIFRTLKTKEQQKTSISFDFLILLSKIYLGSFDSCISPVEGLKGTFFPPDLIAIQEI